MSTFKEISVIVHPLVLLSAVDHYKRLGSKRVVGILLGQVDDDIHVTNSFAIPFEEDSSSWFLDTSYLQNMFELFHKVNSKEIIVGWYHTGPKMCSNDIEITKSLLKYVDDPHLVIINIHSTDYDLPVQVFKLDKQGDFAHVNAKIEAEEAEEVGVEHLIRDIREEDTGSSKEKIKTIKESIRTYEKSLEIIEDYIQKTIEGNVKYNHEIFYLLQDILYSIPYLTGSLDEYQSNTYLSELIKSVVSLHDLSKNRMENDQKIKQ
ncbi:26S proteasome non-ATPase regulatory subunit 7 [Nosema bombycis CQ1]|uniref:26S proteasome non-ATPase regulatory subunit 7 n=1 Tax=Nosema bombycis (strain CQ1 / CVCC 102059) TaxID=578461 RepID=R0KTW0_NOSB1|nr:26S proteasome non-ATPase regulatory subunit 7 [Nosema bombycis CQ1]|eukprot:EOB13672.1 26S proteasome non-ATPase regulatory subunit 7 [Nosema bombycis CQ1]